MQTSTQEKIMTPEQALQTAGIVACHATDVYEEIKILDESGKTLITHINDLDKALTENAQALELPILNCLHNINRTAHFSLKNEDLRTLLDYTAIIEWLARYIFEFKKVERANKSAQLNEIKKTPPQTLKQRADETIVSLAKTPPQTSAVGDIKKQFDEAIASCFRLADVNESKSMPPLHQDNIKDHVENFVDSLAKTPLKNQEGGDHYKNLKIQPVEYIHANGIGFAEGSVIKYVTRWENKNGIEDLKKARHFLDLLIQLETENAEA